ncbi:L-threonylcarbamoyladenylate synthase [Gephyromycinifex aptenodytis]|uniref:L-threonylcarbamoyladenylate synthase n=1 Tax=Gephyromycinifex aptenodytis TaxID=2716227 RepID=UPI0014459FF7|nr:L-threonylcarbamoyladenylate synthase [Gephyromycinifex aptenodytis]
MARYVDVHPVNPQARLITRIVERLREGALIAYPTSSGYALGVTVGNLEGRTRMQQIRHLQEGHHFTLLCRDFAQLGSVVFVSNAVFRSVKSATPGPYTFLLKATPEVPRRLSHPKKHTVGVRIPEDAFSQALLAELGEPLLTTTLILPGSQIPLVDGWVVKDELDHAVDIIVDTGECGTEPTTVVDLSGDEAEILRYGAGDASRFE